MPRVAEARVPAIPSTAGQKDRYQRILRAAAEHGAAHGIDGIQMLDVAKDAGVAIATLYRYFPSKTVLFTALLHSQVGRLDEMTPALSEVEDPAEAVGQLLVGIGARMLRSPLLAHAMLISNNAAVAGEVPTLAVTGVFADLMFKVAGVTDPSPYDVRLIRLVEQTWYGVLTSQLTGHITAADADADTRLACRLLLGDLGRR
ncbi:TetR/AcrR family transcriptional regulator [Nocardioides sp. BGMRC 2183]|nr:TetR/AcrR family transcriptional regulator [Nocardioides sp. BGMRC 2183]